MNRQKAIKKKYIRKLKQARAKNAPKNRERYISKADREAQEARQQNEQLDQPLESQSSSGQQQP